MSAMKDLTIVLEDRPGALAQLGEVLGRASVSIEGGAAFVCHGSGIAHYLFDDAAPAREVLEAAGITVLAERRVLIQTLRQSVPGQLGAITRRMAAAGVNIEAQYSDHAHRLILVVDDIERGRVVSDEWMRDGRATESDANQK
jgi:hypothetical protein